MEYIGVNTKSKVNGVCGLSKNVFEAIAIYSLDDYNKAKVIPGSAVKRTVACKVGKEGITMNMDLQVKTGYNVTDVCHEVQDIVAKSIINMTEISNVVVNINIKGFYI